MNKKFPIISKYVTCRIDNATAIFIVRKGKISLIKKENIDYREGQGVHVMGRTGYGSERYGNCERCKEHADSVYLVSRYYLNVNIHNNMTLVSQGDIFGHQKCALQVSEGDLITVEFHSEKFYEMAQKYTKWWLKRTKS